MYAQYVEAVLNKYSLSYQQIFPAQKGYRNESYRVELIDGTSVNLLFYKQEYNILHTIELVDKLGELLTNKGLPVRTRLDNRTLQLASLSKRIYVGLYNYLDGNTIAWDAYTMEHLKLLGAMMARLHHAMQDIVTMPNNQPVTEVYSNILNDMKLYFGSNGVKSAMHKKLHIDFDESILSYFQQLLNNCSMLSNQQWLHMDFVRGNVLFNQKHGQLDISGVIDFEKAAIGHPWFDIARTLAFLLVDCKYKTANQVEKYFLYSGYFKRGNAELAHIHIKTHASNQTLLYELVKLFWLHDFYKLLLHNPYEYLKDNEHYVRTQDMLLQSNMIHLYT